MSKTLDARRPARKWRKASASQSQSLCVEVACEPDAVYVRSSRDPCGPELSFTHGEWLAFVDGVVAGEFAV